VTEQAVLALEDGSLFHGVSVGAPGRTIGEVVFNTAMTGYQEILTGIPAPTRMIMRVTGFMQPDLSSATCRRFRVTTGQSCRWRNS